ncbi:protein FIZZY-RELATED 2-like [Hordeum vulgare]|nr:protein FIZZY-RELATED 2-like [Hordeum vulgare]
MTTLVPGEDGGAGMPRRPFAVAHMGEVTVSTTIKVSAWPSRFADLEPEPEERQQVDADSRVPLHVPSLHTPGAAAAPSPPSSDAQRRGPATSSAASAPATPASRTVYSDRFIPSHTGSNLALFDLTPAPSVGSVAPSPYCALLRVALFGPDTLDRLASSVAASSSSSRIGSPAGGNIFLFKAEVPRNAKRAIFVAGDDQDLLFPGLFSPKGSGPRKIPRSPYKAGPRLDEALGPKSEHGAGWRLGAGVQIERR